MLLSAQGLVRAHPAPSVLAHLSPVINVILIGVLVNPRLVPISFPSLPLSLSHSLSLCLGVATWLSFWVAWLLALTRAPLK